MFYILKCLITILVISCKGGTFGTLRVKPTKIDIYSNLKNLHSMITKHDQQKAMDRKKY